MERKDVHFKNLETSQQEPRKGIWKKSQEFTQNCEKQTMMIIYHKTK